MTDIVTGTPAVVGFTNGHDNHHGDYGMTGKDFDAMLVGHARISDEHRTGRILDFTAANGVAIEKTGAANQLATEKTAAATQLSIEKVGAAAILEAQKNSAAGILYAAQNHAAALAQAAECCCALKELIRAEGGQTRDLINANTVQGLRDALAAAQRFVPLTVPVPI